MCADRYCYTKKMLHYIYHKQIQSIYAYVHIHIHIYSYILRMYLLRRQNEEKETRGKTIPNRHVSSSVGLHQGNIRIILTHVFQYKGEDNIGLTRIMILRTFPNVHQVLERLVNPCG